MAEPALLIHHTAGAPEPVRFAALELARYLGRMTDRSFPVVQAPAAAWTPLELRLGAAAERAPLAGLLPGRVRLLADAYATAPGVDAFIRRGGGRGLGVAGTNARSTLYGGYDMLEEPGCRFYGAHPDDEVVPRRDDGALRRFLDAPSERFEQAAFAYRERHFLEPLRAPEASIDAAAALREIDHAAKRRLNGFAFHIEDFAPDPAAWRAVLTEL